MPEKSSWQTRDAKGDLSRTVPQQVQDKLTQKPCSWFTHSAQQEFIRAKSGLDLHTVLDVSCLAFEFWTCHMSIRVDQVLWWLANLRWGDVKDLWWDFFTKDATLQHRSSAADKNQSLNNGRNSSDSDNAVGELVGCFSCFFCKLYWDPFGRIANLVYLVDVWIAWDKEKRHRGASILFLAGLHLTCIW